MTTFPFQPARPVWPAVWRLLLLGLLALAAVTIAGCSEAEGDDPPLPDMLVEHPELSPDDPVSARTERALETARAYLEPRWGPLRAELYRVAPIDVSHVQDAVAAEMPAGWMPVDLPRFPPGEGALFGYAFKSRLFAVLTVEPRAATDFPVVTFTSAPVR